VHFVAERVLMRQLECGEVLPKLVGCAQGNLEGLVGYDWFALDDGDVVAGDLRERHVYWPVVAARLGELVRQLEVLTADATLCRLPRGNSRLKVEVLLLLIRILIELL